MDELALDILDEKFSLRDYNNVNMHIRSIQDKYIMSRIRFFWKLPLVLKFTATKLITVFSTPDIQIVGIENDEFQVVYSQRAMVMGKTEFWANRLLKRRCLKINMIIAGYAKFLEYGRRK